MQNRLWLIGLSCGVFLVCGCARQFAMIERPKGEITLRQPEASKVEVVLDPATASVSQAGIDVTIRYANFQELDRFFSNKEIFGNLAGKNPYPPDTLIFYVKLFNHSGKKIRVNPDDFVLIDNLNIQYAELSPDNISALYESKANVWSYVKTTGDLAPGPYGVPLKVAGAFGSGGGRKLHYLIKQVRLAGGYVHPGISYDGYVAFPRPHPKASSIRLVVANIKTEFNAADQATQTVDFEFSLYIKSTQIQEPEQPKPSP